jgi:hypothetical protein
LMNSSRKFQSVLSLTCSYHFIKFVIGIRHNVLITKITLGRDWSDIVLVLTGIKQMREVALHGIDSSASHSNWQVDKGRD